MLVTFDKISSSVIAHVSNVNSGSSVSMYSSALISDSSLALSSSISLATFFTFTKDPTELVSLTKISHNSVGRRCKHMSHFVCKRVFLSLYSRISPVLTHKGRRYITNASLLFLIISSAKKR